MTEWEAKALVREFMDTVERWGVVGAIRTLLPEGEALVPRLPQMVTVSALAAGTLAVRGRVGGLPRLPGGAAVGPVTVMCVQAGGCLDTARLRELCAACEGAPEVLMDVLAELMALYTVLAAGKPGGPW